VKCEDSAASAVDSTQTNGDVDVVAEARLLRQHKGRLEARMRVLEEHNEQLESQLKRLRQLLHDSVQQVRHSVNHNHYHNKKSELLLIRRATASV